MMDLFMESDILSDVQDCGCEMEAPPAFTLPPPPPPPGFHYLQDPHEDTHVESSSTPLPWTCPVLVSTSEYHQDALFSSVAAGCVAVLLLVLAVIVTVASRRRSPARHYSPSPIYRPTPSASKPGPRTPCRASYASLEHSFAAGHFSGAGCPSPSPTYCSPCSPSPSRVLPATPSSSRMVVRYHTSSRSFSHSLARPHVSARTQTAHPHRSPLYRPRLARVMSGQLLVLPAGGASPCLGHKFPGIEMNSAEHRAVDNVYSPLPVPSAHTAFVFP